MSTFFENVARIGFASIIKRTVVAWAETSLEAGAGKVHDWIKRVTELPGLAEAAIHPRSGEVAATPLAMMEHRIEQWTKYWHKAGPTAFQGSIYILQKLSYKAQHLADFYLIEMQPLTGPMLQAAALTLKATTGLGGHSIAARELRLPEEAWDHLAVVLKAAEAQATAPMQLLCNLIALLPKRGWGKAHRPHLPHLQGLGSSSATRAGGMERRAGGMMG